MQEEFGKIVKVNKISPKKDKNQIIFEVVSEDGKKGAFVSEYNKYCDWLGQKKGLYKHVAKDFIDEFLSGSKSQEKELSEIIDTYGNIMPDDDKPSNANGKEIGSSNFDTDKVVSQSIAKHYLYYSGNFGGGLVTW